MVVALCAMAMAPFAFGALPPAVTSRTLTPFALGTQGSRTGWSQVQGPTHIAVDPSGNVYILDLGTATPFVVKASMAGGVYAETRLNISLSRSPNDLAVDASGNIYLSIPESDVLQADGYVLKETLSNGSYTASTIKSGFYPSAVAVDGSGNVYIGDYWNFRVLKETPTGGSYTETVVLDSNSGLVTARGINVDPGGNVYVADSNSGRVFKATLSGGTYTAATLFTLAFPANPVSIAIDKSGNLFISDQGNSVVLEESPSGSGYTQKTIAGPEITDANLYISFQGSGVALDPAGNLYIADFPSKIVWKEDFSGSADLGRAPIGGRSPVDAWLYFDLQRFLHVVLVRQPGGVLHRVRHVHHGDDVQRRRPVPFPALPPALLPRYTLRSHLSDRQQRQPVDDLRPWNRGRPPSHLLAPRHGPVQHQRNLVRRSLVTERHSPLAAGPHHRGQRE